MHATYEYKEVVAYIQYVYASVEMELIFSI
jgi:hypothetical protein